jgi:hypothetical protein
MTPDEATELCVYHLRMAAALFQIVPDDNNVSLLDEIDRQCADDTLDCDVKPARAWATEIYRIYEEMKKRD